MGLRFLVLLLAALSAGAGVASPNYRVHFNDEFTPQQQQKLQRWIDFGFQHSVAVVGEFPFTVHFKVKRRQANEPVPWASTNKGRIKTINLVVDPDFSEQQFIGDWTLYHEISHMALPYLGEQDRWLAEGFASFMQYQIMAHADLLNQTPKQLYRQRLTQYRKHYQQQSALSTAQDLIKQRRYPPAYWLGASFFNEVDQRLTEKDLSLVAVIQDYQRCCRQQRHNTDQLFQQLDKVSHSHAFVEALTVYRTKSAQAVYQATSKYVGNH